jgi:hypothetical protein
MRGKIVARIALLAIMGVLGMGAGVALGWDGSSGQGQFNGQTNKKIGGCPSNYVLIPSGVALSVDLNHDGYVCDKPVGGSGDRFNDIDNQSNP